ncbi:hypothetical protein MYU51_005331 [Penicillium brevicompactum]|uniref:uncharacterized protein n=1 Tax=Penicillium brevicompactum TaxID=5074 RepID=UPI0025412850|nr:uncharacterized protein N7506_006767 [Penicillium brevicompactum]KAJ5332984.1 hypothetical protein N7506_006767 [Penicillium brevicompactum]
MSSPAKATDGKIADLSPSELRLMVFSNLCYGEVKPDTEKLAKLTGIKRRSAASMWLPAKRKLEAFVNRNETTDDKDAANQSSPAASPAKPRTIKRRKTVSKRVVEESDTEEEQLKKENDDDSDFIPTKNEKIIKEESDE